MFPGFEKIIEQRIREAQQKGAFKDLPGAGKPLNLDQDANVPEELRIAYRMLKNADCLPPEIELKKEIRQTEELLAGMQDTAEKYSTMKKLNFMIMRLNTLRSGSVELDVPEKYSAKLVEKIEAGRRADGKKIA